MGGSGRGDVRFHVEGDGRGRTAHPRLVGRRRHRRIGVGATTSRRGKIGTQSAGDPEAAAARIT
jgi:hypothetical protein